MQVASLLPLLQTTLLLLHRHLTALPRPQTALPLLQTALPLLQTALPLLQTALLLLLLLQSPLALSFSPYPLLAPQAASPARYQSQIPPPRALQVNRQSPLQLPLLLPLQHLLPFRLPFKARPSWQKPYQHHQQQTAAMLELVTVVSQSLCCPLCLATSSLS